MGSWILILFLSLDGGIATIPQYQNQKQCRQAGEDWKKDANTSWARYGCVWHPHPYTLPPGAR